MDTLRRSYLHSNERDFTYPVSLVGTTEKLIVRALTNARIPAPAGYHLIHEEANISGEFPTAAAQLLNWGMQRGAGLQVYAPDGEPSPGNVVVTGFGIGAMRMPVPCRVIWVRKEPDFVGFAYGTLPGHPESGEEAFWVQRDDGHLRVGVLAFSRPGRWFTKLGAPVGRIVQRRIIKRYLRSLNAPTGH